MPKSTTKTKSVRVNVERWNDQHRLLSRLLEEEVHGMIHYLRSLHYLSIFVISISSLGLILALRSIFENGQHALTGFAVACLACMASITLSVMSLRPWILPRFLLPIDIRQLRYDEMLAVTASPREYIHLLKHHIQKLTDTYLLPKLRFLRLAIFALIFGLALAILLGLALP